MVAGHQLNHPVSVSDQHFSSTLVCPLTYLQWLTVEPWRILITEWWTQDQVPPSTRLQSTAVTLVTISLGLPQEHVDLMETGPRQNQPVKVCASNLAM